MSESERGEWETSKERMRAHGGFSAIGELLTAPAPTLTLPVTPPLTAQVTAATPTESPTQSAATPSPAAPSPAALVPVGLLDAQQRGLTKEPLPLVGKGIVPRRGLTHFAGEDKSGKTQRILQLAAEGTHGTPVFGEFPVSQPFRTLLLEAELEWPTLSERLEGIATALKLDRQRINDNFKIMPIPSLNVLNPKDYKRIADCAAGFDLLILDPISSFYLDADENDNSKMQTVANALRRLNRELDIAILTTGHLRKPTAGLKGLDLSTAFDAVRGATSYRAAMDTVIVIQTGNHVAWDFFVRTRRPTNGTESTEEYTLGSLSAHWVLAKGQRLYAKSTATKAKHEKMMAWVKQHHSAGTLPTGKEQVYAKATEEGVASSRPSAQRTLKALEREGEIVWRNDQPIPGTAWSTSGKASPLYKTGKK